MEKVENVVEEGKKKERKPLIEVKNVRKIYRMGDEKVVALDNVSLTIDKGEIVCFLGTSGSGKSTFLNMVAGLEKPTKGEINIGGIPIHKLNEANVTLFRQKNIGFIFQAYHLMAMLTAIENVSLPLIFKGIEKKKRNKMAKDMLNAVGLKGYDKRKPSQMSGGQQQRVGIARALVAKPKIIFADEPTGNLDTNTTKEVMGLMVEMVRENNQTLIIVTHDRTIAEYADKVVTIQDGNILNIKEKNSFSAEVGKDDLVVTESVVGDGSEDKGPEHKESEQQILEQQEVVKKVVKEGKREEISSNEKSKLL